MINILRDKLLTLLPKPGRLKTAVSGVAISRIDAHTPGTRCFYAPMIALVVQGYKRAMIGGRETGYGKGHYAVIGVDVPGVYHITEASPDAPFLSLSVKLDRHILSDLIRNAPNLIDYHAEPLNPAAVSKAGEEMLDAFIRLVNVLDSPSRITVLAPLLIREIHFYLLEGIHGQALCLFHTNGTAANQIARAIAWLKEHYASSLRMDDLARHVHMAPTTFYRYFKEVTGLSPLQFQKQLRLYEAERLMLFEGKDAGTAAFMTGYESGSHFSRDYKRHFGLSPHRDVTKKRA